MKPRVKLENDDYLKQKAEFMTSQSQKCEEKILMNLLILIIITEFTNQIADYIFLIKSQY